MHIKSATQQSVAGDGSLISFGSSIKAMGDGRIGGHLVIFDSKDLSGDVFTKDTDFGIQDGAKTAVYFNHRLPLKTRDGKRLVIKQKIGEGTLTKAADGVLIDAILFNRDEYEGALEAMGWSSGTAAHLVEREAKDGASYIKAWPLGLDASITPVPCEPSTKVLSLKYYLESLTEEKPALKGLFENELVSRTLQTWDLRCTLDRVFEKIANAVRNSDVTGVKPDVAALVAEAVTAYDARFIPAVIQQITDFADSGDDHFWLKSFDRLTGGLVSGAPLQDHSDVVVSAAKEHAENRAAFSEAVKGYTQRAENKLKFRIDDETKIGRKLSKANCEQMSVISAELRKGATADVELADTLDRLVATAMPKAADDDQKSLSEAARQELAKFLHTESRLLQAA